ncbi:MAG: hypothetical protein WD801_09345, partial [Gemmatimonadaceae bacterium]
RAAISFLEGLGAWDWPKVVVSAGTLIASQDSLRWIPDALLRNGATIGHIKLRNYQSAKEVQRSFARIAGVDPFRDRLIATYLAFSDTARWQQTAWR